MLQSVNHASVWMPRSLDASQDVSHVGSLIAEPDGVWALSGSGPQLQLTVPVLRIPEMALRSVA
eukprot:6291779-Alexandrium_andersonii.AAC.1